jgi:hypothetical protein
MRCGALLVLAGVAAGGLGFGFAHAGPEPARAWLALLVHLLFAGSVAQGAILYAAFLRLTGARAALPLHRVAESGLLVVLVLPLGILAVLALAGPEIWPWLPAPEPAFGRWFTRPAMLGRAALAWGGMALASLAFVEPGRGRARRRQRGRAAAVAFACFLGLSLAAFDLVLPLAPGGRNALLGATFFASAFHGGLAAIALAARLLPPRLLPAPLRPPRAEADRAAADLGLLLGISALFLLYLLASQFITIWYGNLREETAFFLRRLAAPWRGLVLVALAAAYVIPAVSLLGFRRARRGAPLAVIAAIALCGLWLERYLLVAPSLRARPALGFPELAFAAGVCLVLAGASILYLHGIRSDLGRGEAGEEE